MQMGRHIAMNADELADVGREAAYERSAISRCFSHIAVADSSVPSSREQPMVSAVNSETMRNRGVTGRSALDECYFFVA
jgi:hypothetical protein